MGGRVVSVARRPLVAGIVGGVGLAAVLGVWLTTGLRDARARANAIERAPIERADRLAAELARELGRRLDDIVRVENKRPYYQYQNLYHDPRGAGSGQFVIPSPLADATAGPFVASHYQIGRDGRLTIPTINDQLPQLSQQTALADNKATLDAYRASAGELGGDLVSEESAAVQVAAAAPAPALDSEQIQQIDPSVYMQNAAPNIVYQQIKGEEVDLEGAAAVRGGPVEVTTEPFKWRTATIGREPELVAVRVVDTPDGRLAQGMVLDRAAVDAWLAELAGTELFARLTTVQSKSEAAVLLDDIDGAWQVAVDTGAAAASAASAAAEVKAQFWRLFLPAAALAVLCIAIIVWLVARADKLARERSRFAAAAAHELRTPLAGLQLYGDMLADGLGDRDRTDQYARRIADEASRLGRVVGNVLGFTQLERGTLSIDASPGDAAEAARAAVDRARPSLEHAGIDVTTDIPDAAPARFDPDAVARILQNLLDNADKHTRGRDARRVMVRVLAGDDGVAIEVEDDGPGVPRRMRAKLFHAFERGAADDGPAGLGLGLSLARALARAQGGDLDYADGASGAKFVLRLPA